MKNNRSKKQNQKNKKNTSHKKSSFNPKYIPFLIIALSVFAFYFQLLISKYFMWEDSISYHYSNIACIVNQLKHGIFPWWNPYSFGGNVLAADIQACMFYPPHWIMLSVQTITGANITVLAWYVTLHLLLMGSGQYKVLRDFGLGRMSSSFGSVGLILSGYITGQFIHMIFILAASWMPWTFLFLRKTLVKKQWKYALYATLTLGLSMLGGLPQVSVHFFYFLGLYAVFHIYTEKEYGFEYLKKSIPKLTLIFLFAIGIASVIYVQTFELINYTPRQNMTIKEAIGDSIYPERLITLFAPKHFGAITGLHSIPNTFWAKGGSWMYWEGQLYVSIILLIFAVLGFIKWKSKTKYFLLIIAILAIVSSMGKTFPLFKIIWYTVPGMKLFRVPSRFLYYFAFCVSILGAYGMQTLFKAKDNEYNKIIKSSSIITGTFALIWIVFSMGFFKETSGALANDQIYSNTEFEWLTQTLILASFTSLLYFFKNSRKLLLILIIGLMWVDFYKAHGNFNNGDTHPQNFYPQNNLVNFFKNEGKKDLFRVNARIGNNMIMQKNQGMVSNIYTLQGYNPLRPLGLFRIEQLVPIERVWDLFNAKYGITINNHSREIGVIERPTYLKKFRFCDSVVVIPDTGEVFRTLSQDNFPYKSTIILTKPIPNFNYYPVDPTYDQIEVNQYSPNKIVLKVKCKENKILIGSENYFPAWKARIDGKKQKIYVGDRTFWVIPVNKGIHEIVFYYSSTAFYIGALISLLTLTIIGTSLLIIKRKNV